MKHSKLTQLGRKHTYTQKVATTMNWYRRCIMGLMEQIKFSSGYFIQSAQEYEQMSESRKKQLSEIFRKKLETTEKIEDLLRSIETFQTLPITIEDEQKMKLPKRRTKQSADTP